MKNTRAIHKDFGIGTIEETFKKFHPRLDNLYCYFRPDTQRKGYAAVLLIDVEALQIVE